jgi:hypothetical protein
MNDDAPLPPIPISSAVIQPTETGAVLMNTVTGDCFELNRVGAEIWRLLLAGEATAAIASKLSASYDVPEAAAAADVESLITSLAQHGLIDLRPK